MYEPSMARTKKGGGCRAVAVVKRWLLVEAQLYFSYVTNYNIRTYF